MPLDLDAHEIKLPGFGGGDLADLDAVTVSMRRAPFATAGIVHCDWAQETATVSIYLSVGKVRGRDLDVKIKSERLVVSRKPGGIDLLKGNLGGACDVGESEWEIVDGELQITLRKRQQREWAVPLHPEPITFKPTPSPAAAAPSQPVKPMKPVPIVDYAGSEEEEEEEARIIDVTEAPRANGTPAQRATPPPAKAPASRPRGQTSNLGEKYQNWDHFDDIGALTGLENEGKSADEPGFTLRAGGGVASMQCTEYVKEREEVALDEELAAKREHLQNTLNQHMVRAGELKAKGNSLLGKGDSEGALRAYLMGVQELGLGESAKILLSRRLGMAMEALIIDLRSNAAAACLKIEDWEGAIECADEVLEAHPGHEKALFRRARAYASKDEPDRARIDLQALLAAQPRNAAARKLLAELPEKDEVLV